MGIYYFTHSIEAGGGWTKVVLSGVGDRYEFELSEFDLACEAYSFFHPRKDGFVDCAFIYDAEEFNSSGMRQNGNAGRGCIETITLTREAME